MAVVSAASNLIVKIITELAPVASNDAILACRLDVDLNILRYRAALVISMLSNAPSQFHPTMELWIGQVATVFQRANEFLDNLEHMAARQQVEHHSKVRKFFSLFDHFTMAHRIENINKSMNRVYNRGIEVGLKPQTDLSATSTERPRMPPTVDESGIQGRAVDKTNIIQMLCLAKRDEKLISVVAIVGMPGLGKTTLAQLVYNDVEVEDHFGKKIWITVSQNFNAVDILNLMVESLDQRNRPQKVPGALLFELEGLLGNSKLLLVLEDVWNVNVLEWKRLNDSLIGINVQILVTTRSLRVAEIMQSSTYHLGKLSFKDSWKIFQHKVFSVGRAPEEVFIDMGEKMVHRCDGLPLALTILGGLLQDKNSESEWSWMESHPCWLTLAEDHLPILRISFDDLQLPSLKSRFEFCSIFPKNFVFQEHVLIQLWMVLDSISSNSTEDVEEKNFKILYQKSLFEDCKMSSHPLAQEEVSNLCCMHDLVHDLAQEVSKKDCATIEISMVNDVPPTVVHLRLMGGYIEKISKPFEKCLGKLQTLYLEVEMPWTAASVVFEMLKNLRILILSNRKINHLPNTIGNLKNLRYIDISGTSIKTLPDSVFGLYLLQTLRVNCLNNLSKTFKALTKLRHLNFNSVYGSMGCVFTGISALIELQSLSFFVVSKTKGCLLEELGGLKNLSLQLCIYGLEDVNNKDEAKKAKLDDKSKISSLKFYWKERSGDNDEHNDEDVLEGLEPHLNLKQLLIMDYKGKKCAGWMTILHNLVKLELIKCHECECVPALGHLHSLQELCIRSLPKLQEWVEVVERKDLNIFPCLEVLRIEYCPRLKNVPYHFPSLKELYIWEVGVKNWWFKNAFLTRVKMGYCPYLMKLNWGVNLDVPFHYLEEVSLNYFPKLVEWVEGVGADVSLSSASTSDPRSEIFPRLEKLEIKNCSELKNVPSYFPSLKDLQIMKVGVEKWCFNSASLTRVEMRECPDLMKLNWGVNIDAAGCGGVAFHYIEKLILTGLPKLVEWVEGVGGDVSLSSSPTSNRRSGIFPRLEKLVIEGCPRLKNVPNHFPSLKELDIGWVGVEKWCFSSTSLTRVEMWGCRDLMKLNWGVNMDVAGGGGVACHYLEKLCLENLPKLVEWVEGGVGGDVSLSSASTSDPSSGIFPRLLELDIVSCPELRHLPVDCLHSCTSLLELYINDCYALHSLPDLQYCTSLQELRVQYCHTLHSLPDLQYCKSLQILYISNCRALHSVPDLQSSTSLWHLSIQDCPALHSVPDLQYSTSLRHLTIQDCPALHSVPNLQGSTMLESLMMGGFDGMESLPEWLGTLFNLRELHIWDCSNVKELPSREAMTGLSKLDKIWIQYCPLLEEKLREENGSERNKIPLIFHNDPSNLGMLFSKFK